MSDASGRTPGPKRDVRPAVAGIAPCLLYLAIEFGRPMDWIGAIGVVRPGLLAAVWGFGVFLFARRRPIPRPMILTLLLLAQMAWSVPWASNLGLAFQSFQNIAIILLGGVLPLATLPVGLAAVRVLVSAYFFLHIPMAVHGLLHAGTGAGGGWLADENDLALALNAAIGVGTYLMIEAPKASRKILVAVAIGLMLAAVVATNSRGGFLGLAAVAVYLVAAGPNRKAILALVLAGAIGLALFAGPAYWNEVRTIGSAHETGDTGEARLYLWTLAWRMFVDHPVLGVGNGNFGANAPEYEDKERANLYGEHSWGRAAHSMYFQLLSEQGTVGTLLFVAIVGGAAARLLRVRRSARARPGDPGARSERFLGSALAAGVVGVLGSGAFLSVLYYPVLWVLIAMCCSLDAATSGGRAPGVEAGSGGSR